MKSWLFTCSYESDMKRFCELVKKTEGAHLEGVVELPFRNIWGQEISKQYGIIYSSDTELEMEILCGGGIAVQGD